MAASTSGSANAAKPSMRSEPARDTVVPASSSERVNTTPCRGPPEPLIDCSRAVASSGLAKSWVSSTCRPPSAVATGGGDRPSGGFGVGEVEILREPGRLLDDIGIGDRGDGDGAAAIGAHGDIDGRVDMTRSQQHHSNHDEAPAHSVPIVACGTSPTPEVSRGGNSSTMTTERTEPSDIELVTRARAGDAAAFGALVGRYQPAAMRLAAAISGSVDDAADIAQEAFVKAHRSLPKLADPAMVRPWMLRIVANEAKNVLRGRGRRRQREQRYGSWVVAAVSDPEGSALAADDARDLGLALGRIGARDRQVLAYRYFAGLSEAETARARSMSPPARSNREPHALWPACAPNWSNHDRSRTVTRRARCPAGDPRRRVAGRRCRPSHRRACSTSSHRPHPACRRSARRRCRCRCRCPARPAAGGRAVVGVRQRAHRAGRDRSDDIASATTAADRATICGLGPARCRSVTRCRAPVLPTPRPRCSATRSRSTSCNPLPPVRSCWCMRRPSSCRSPR